jgi:hypothetical protein
LTPIKEPFGFLSLLAADPANGFSVAGQRHVVQRLVALSTAVTCALRHHMRLLRSKQSSGQVAIGRRWAPPPPHLGVSSSLFCLLCGAASMRLKNGVPKVILVQPKCVLMRAKRGRYVLLWRLPDLLSIWRVYSSRARAKLQLHVAGRTDICAIEFSGASAPGIILL